jgi:hypothetical protein
MHKSLHEKGIIDNETFIKHLNVLEQKLEREFYILLEMKASKEDVNFVKETLSH